LPEIVDALRAVLDHRETVLDGEIVELGPDGATELSPLSGSSISRTGGLRTRARPIPTRCFWPPDNSLGLRPRRAVICRRSAVVATLSARSAAGTLAIRRVFEREEGGVLWM